MEITIPNKEYLELNFVGETATGRGLNEVFIMENLHNGTFQVTDGRVGITIGRFKPKKYCLPISNWEETIKRRLSRGYIITKTQKTEKITASKALYKPISDEEIADIVERLIDFANEVLEENITIKIDNISPEMLNLGNDILLKLSTEFENMSTAEFNNLLKRFYTVIPRRIDNLNSRLAKGKSDFNDIVANEQDFFDIVKTAIKDNKEIFPEKTILDTKGITFRTVTDTEKEWIIKKLGSEGMRYKNAWKVENLKTRAAFDSFCKSNNLTDGAGVDKLFHGSKNENFWSIITNGLTINPVGVQITGKAYGNGTYFAPQAVKSMGYTSRTGSKWAKGTCDSGFLGIYSVATGNNRYNGSGGCNHSLNYKTLQEICPGALCTWAEARYSGFIMDEVIVYQDQQSTVEYLVEVGL